MTEETKLRHTLKCPRRGGLDAMNAPAAKSYERSSTRMAKAVACEDASRSNQFANFLDLPVEIRTQIYELYAQLENNQRDRKIYISTSTKSCNYALLEASSLIRKEALPFCYGSRPFVFRFQRPFMPRIMSFVTRRSNASIATIRYVELCGFQDYHIRLFPEPNSHSPVCRTRMRIDLTNATQPVRMPSVLACNACMYFESEVEGSVQRVRNVVQTLELRDGQRWLTREKLVEMFEAAAWPVEILGKAIESAL